MKRLLGAVVAMVLLVGCRAPAPPNDPFLYRSTIPPPGTITPGVAPAGQPYYPAPAPGAVPGLPTISPGVPVSPTAPLGPTGVPVSPGVPAPAPSKYAPPGGFNYQSSLRSPAAIPQPQSSPATLASHTSTDPAVVTAANWQVPKADRADSPILTPIAAQPRPEPSVVRIIEPAKSTLPAAANDSLPAPATNDSAVTPTAPAAATPSTSTPESAAPTPVTISTATAASSAVAKTADPPAVPEITDFPAVANGATSRLKPATEESTPVNIPAERPGASYGYDADYKMLRGKLEYSVASRRWKLIYMPPDGAIDEFGGSVVLPDASQLAGFEAGDFITVSGVFSAPTATTGAPMFSIQRIKRQ
jgi:hypothetical protein